MSPCKRTPDKMATLRAMAANGHFASEIARELGVSAMSVAAWARAADIRLPTKQEAGRRICADPAIRAKMKAALATDEVRQKRSDAQRARHAGASGVIVPRWVPSDLADDFLQMAAARGEEAAASHIRKVKRELQVSL